MTPRIFDKIQRRLLLVAERITMHNRYRCGRVDGVLVAAKGAGYITITQESNLDRLRRMARKGCRRSDDKKYVISLTDSGWAQTKKWNTIASLGGAG